jgi:PERQ amino acid-rich with GYF domain-containing protein
VLTWCAVDEFIQMLLSFPADPPASQKSDVAEIIADSVYASSSTLDGRRFASEWMTRRKADASRPNGGSSIKGLAATAAGKVGGTSLADVVKMVPKPQSAESGFKIVKTKGKKKI